MDALTIRAATEKDSANLAKFIFLAFIYISDSEKDITPQEVRRFQALMNDLHWTDNEDMCRALTTLRFNYTATWADYEAGKLPADRDALARHLAQFDQEFGTERSNALRTSLGEFIQRIGGSPSLATARLAKGELRGRAGARHELEELMAQPVRAVASPAVADSKIREVAADPEPASAAAASAEVPTAMAMAIGDVAIWQGGRIKVRCIGRVAETRDTTTFTLVSDPPVLFSYKPGQFVTLELPVDGRIQRRSYTISSSPSRPYTLSVTVKHLPDGRLSAWLRDSVVPGVEFELTGPHGRFTCIDRPAAKLLLIAGGSGITPAMSMLRWIADTGYAADAVLINNVRTPEDVIFARELQHLSSRMGDASRLVVVPSRLSPGQSWNGITGRFSETLLRALAPDFLEREIYLCGPESYMVAVRALLQTLGFPKAQLHEESFGGPPLAASVPPAAPAVPAAVPRRIVEAVPVPAPSAVPDGRLVFRNSNRVISCNVGEFILDAADRNAVVVDSSCRSGVCGTCRMRKVSGVVSMECQEALSEQEIAEGYFLACIGQARGTVVIDA
jgi:ferredoxin-NADP reductase